MQGAAMANDEPTNLRMGFGYREARASGLTGFQEERSPRQVNRDLKANQIARRLRDEVSKDPEWSPFVEHWVRSGLSPQEVLQSLHNAQFNAWLRAEPFTTPPFRSVLGARLTIKTIN
jgi:hypothetical protein